MSLIEVRDEGDIRWIGLNRPDKRNPSTRRRATPSPPPWTTPARAPVS